MFFVDIPRAPNARTGWACSARVGSRSLEGEAVDMVSCCYRFLPLLDRRFLCLPDPSLAADYNLRRCSLCSRDAGIPL